MDAKTTNVETEAREDSAFATFAANWGKLKRSGGFNTLKLLAAGFEFGCLVVLGKLLGTPIIIRYLANPNEIISAPLLRVFGAQIGRGTRIKRRIYLDNVFASADSKGDFGKLHIGDNCYIGDGVYFDLATSVHIGDDIIIAGNVHFVTHGDANRSPFLHEKFPPKYEPIHVETGAWVGYGATLLAGSRVGKNSLLGANSLLTRQMEDETVYAGTPSVKVRSLE